MIIIGLGYRDSLSKILCIIIIKGCCNIMNNLLLQLFYIAFNFVDFT